LVGYTQTPEEEQTMATRRKTSKQRPRKTAARRPEPLDDDLTLAEEILRPPSPQEQAAIERELKKFHEFLKQQGIPVPDKPIGAKKLRERLLKKGFDPNSNEFSRGIIEMREE
jgi:hypothetical protein